MNAELEILLRLTIATLIGVGIGIERQRNGKVAGIRSFSTIALGICALVIAGIKMNSGQIDETFLGAIVIGLGVLSSRFGLYHEGEPDLSNITAIWTTGAMAICIGLGEFYVGGVVSALMLVIYFLKDIIPIGKN